MHNILTKSDTCKAQTRQKLMQIQSVIKQTDKKSNIIDIQCGQTFKKFQKYLSLVRKHNVACVKQKIMINKQKNDEDNCK